MENQTEQNIGQTKKEKILIVIFFAILATVLVITYIKYFVLKDYYIQAEVDCDPRTEACFIYECDPKDDEECPENPDERISYYARVMKKANQIPLCDPNDENCDALSCKSGEDCSIILCDDDTKEEGEECNDPVKYAAENPETEEGDEAECEGDSCVAVEEDDSSVEAEGTEEADTETSEDGNAAEGGIATDGE